MDFDDHEHFLHDGLGIDSFTRVFQYLIFKKNPNFDFFTQSE